MQILKYLNEKWIVGMATRLMARYSGKHPRLAVMTGDYVSLKSMLQGRFENQQLTVLEHNVFPSIKNRICIDIGANIGNHSVAFSKHFDRVLAFEPNPRAFDLLCVNAKWYGVIEPISLGASNKKYKAHAVIPTDNQGAARITSTPLGTEAKTLEFECVRVDEHLDMSLFEKVGFIKIDVEGHEYEAMQGCERIIYAGRPILAFELLRKDFEKAERIETLLRSWGYEYFYSVGADLQEIKQLQKKNYKMLLASRTQLP